jgi:DNA-binding Lrp family transcriptional regulator
MKYDYAEIIQTLKELGEAPLFKLSKRLNMNPKAVGKILTKLEEQSCVIRAKEACGAAGTVWAINPGKHFYYPKLKTAKLVEIEIKPDLAAQWLIPSKPHWEKRSIPIVRSIGLGVRQST